MDIDFFLKKLGLEDIFYPEEMKRIISSHYKKGEYLLRADDDVEHLHILLAGELKIMGTSPMGKVYIVDFISNSGLVGEFELLGLRSSCLCDIVASCDSLTLKIPFSLALKKLKEDIRFLFFVTEKLGEKSMKLSIKSLGINLDTSQKNILSLMNSGPKKSFSAREIGEFLGLTDRHARRLLNQMICEGILSKKNNYFSLRENLYINSL